MSVRFEWMGPPPVDYFPPGTDITTGEPACEESHPEDIADSGAIILSGDTCTVIAGSPTQLRSWLVDVLDEIPGSSPMIEHRTHGDPYSDPPRARYCTTCGVLVADEPQHILWHHRQEQRQ